MGDGAVVFIKVIGRQISQKVVVEAIEPFFGIVKELDYVMPFFEILVTNASLVSLMGASSSLHDMDKVQLKEQKMSFS